MANFLVLQTRNIVGDAIPLNAATEAGVWFNGGAMQTPAPPPDGATDQLRIQIPPGTTSLRALVSPRNYWSATQTLNFTDGHPPRFSFEPFQQTNTGLPLIHAPGNGDWIITLPFILGQLKDETRNVSSAFFPRPTLDLDLIGHPCLSSTDVLNQRTAPVTVQHDRLYLFERVRTPRLIAVWKPRGVTIRNWRADSDIAHRDGNTPVNYHLFFPPNPAAPWSPNNAFNNIYLDLIRRYLFVGEPQSPILDKALAYRHAAAFGGGRSGMPIFVFPVKMHGVEIGDLQSKSSVYRLLLEINYLLQRLAGLPAPTHPLGRVALSGFSLGGSHVRRVLESSRSRLSQHLREVYAFDFITERTLNAVRDWFNRDRSSRMMRIYSSGINDSVRSLMPALLGEVGSPISRAFDAAEAHSGNASVVYTPFEFWRPIIPRIHSTQLFGRIHQMNPAIYMYHALSQSGFQ